MPTFRNSSNGDSNTCSLACESGILPLRYRAQSPVFVWPPSVGLHTSDPPQSTSHSPLRDVICIQSYPGVVIPQMYLISVCPHTHLHIFVPVIVSLSTCERVTGSVSILYSIAVCNIHYPALHKGTPQLYCFMRIQFIDPLFHTSVTTPLNNRFVCHCHAESDSGDNILDSYTIGSKHSL